MKRFFAIFLFLGSLSSCAHTSQDVCGVGLPGMEKDADDAILALQPWIPARDRAPASDSAQTFARQDQDIWKKWAEARLVDTQREIDLIGSGATPGNEREAMQELSRAADEFVAFHGFVQQGRTERMIDSLARAREHQRRARELSCQPRK